MIHWIVIIATISQGAGATDAQLLNFVAIQNEAAQQSIHSIAYAIEFESASFKAPDALPDTIHGIGKVIKQGKNQWSTYTHTTTNETTRRREDVTSTVVINDNYLAYLPKANNPVAYRMDHTGLSSMTSDAQNLFSLLTPSQSILDYCFGDDRCSLKLSIEQYPGTWTVERTGDTDANTKYRVTRSQPTDSSKPAAVYVLDPNRGFFITEMSSFSDQGTLWFHRSIEVKELDNGLWFPERYTQDHYDYEKSQLLDSIKLTMRDVRINESFPATQFEVEAFNLDKNDPHLNLIRTNLDGSRSIYVFRSGNLVPRDLIQAAQMAGAKVARAVEQPSDPATPPAETQKQPRPPTQTQLPPPGFLERAYGVLVRHVLLILLLCGLLAIASVAYVYSRKRI